MQKFFQGGAKFGVRTKEGGGGAEAYVECYTLHLLGGGGARMTQEGENAPPPPPPLPLNTARPGSMCD